MELVTQLLLLALLLAPVGVFYFASAVPGAAPPRKDGSPSLALAGLTLWLLLLAVELLALAPLMLAVGYVEDLFRDFFRFGLPGVYAQPPIAAAGATGLLTIVNSALMALLALWDPLGRAADWVDRGAQAG